MGGLLLALLAARAAAWGDMCSPGHASEGGCMVDGTGCAGEHVEFAPYVMNVSTWDSSKKERSLTGRITSYAIKGHKESWQMYLHGPHIHERERTSARDMPPVYVFATFTNKIYRFENFTRPGTPSEPLCATQKVVGHALAPSTGYVLEDADDRRVRGMLVAEGQPFWVSNLDTLPPKEIYKGGVQYLPSHPPAKDAEKGNCSEIFPVNSVHRMFGQVVNTVDCHQPTGICFFSVWKFYDDQHLIWNKITELFANDCLWYCVVGRRSDGEPYCLKTDVVVDETSARICHRDGVGAVHGLEVGNTDPKDGMKFDVLLVFTGKASMTNGESSMRKVAVQVVGEGDSRDLKVLHSVPFAADLFQHYAPKGFDVGGDHAWVDSTGKYVWVSCFRQHGVGMHMLDYESGELLYSVTGLDTYVPDQYTYTAGIHGVGTLGREGSFLVVATCSCHDVKVCIPTIPWSFPVPKSWWSTGVFFVVDLSTMTPTVQTLHV